MKYHCPLRNGPDQRKSQLLALTFGVFYDAVGVSDNAAAKW
jgi:hypothetical protein